MKKKLTCDFCVHVGTIYYDPFYEEDDLRDLKKPCPGEYFFDHPDPKKCPNFVLNEERWRIANLPHGKVVRAIKRDDGTKRLILRCPKCGYEWGYKGKLYMATCPNCLAKVPVSRVGRRAIQVRASQGKGGLGQTLGTRDEVQEIGPLGEYGSRIWRLKVRTEGDGLSVISDRYRGCQVERNM